MRPSRRSWCAPTTTRPTWPSRAGKQDWQREPHSIWYPRTTGIWQTVWLEKVPASSIASLRWSANLEQWDIGLQAMVDGDSRQELLLRVRLHVNGQTLSDDRYLVLGGEVRRRIAFSDPGIDDYRNELLWSPTNPTLVQANLQLTTADGRPIDEVDSYTALRSVAIQGERFLLNGRVQDLRMVLDQGYWPESGLTAPDDEALLRDVQLTRADGLQRRPQAPEDREPALSLLGGRAGAAGLGGDAERVPFHPRVDRAADARVGRT